MDAWLCGESGRLEWGAGTAAAAIPPPLKTGWLAWQWGDGGCLFRLPVPRPAVSAGLLLPLLGWWCRSDGGGTCVSLLNWSCDRSVGDGGRERQGWVDSRDTWSRSNQQTTGRQHHKPGADWLIAPQQLELCTNIVRSFYRSGINGGAAWKLWMDLIHCLVSGHLLTNYKVSVSQPALPCSFSGNKYWFRCFLLDSQVRLRGAVNSFLIFRGLAFYAITIFVQGTYWWSLAALSVVLRLKRAYLFAL